MAGENRAKAREAPPKAFGSTAPGECRAKNDPMEGGAGWSGRTPGQGSGGRTPPRNLSLLSPSPGGLDRGDQAKTA